MKLDTKKKRIIFGIAIAVVIIAVAITTICICANYNEKHKYDDFDTVYCFAGDMKFSCYFSYIERQGDCYYILDNNGSPYYFPVSSTVLIWKNWRGE